MRTSCLTCCSYVSYADFMSTLQVRDIPEPLTRALKSHTAAVSQSPSSYVLDRLSHAVEQPTAEEVVRQIAGREWLR